MNQIDQVCRRVRRSAAHEQLVLWAYGPMAMLPARPNGDDVCHARQRGRPDGVRHSATWTPMGIVTRPRGPRRGSSLGHKAAVHGRCVHEAATHLPLDKRLIRLTAREQLRMRPTVLDDALGENSNLTAIRSTTVRSHPRQSKVIRGHQRPSEAIRAPRRAHLVGIPHSRQTMRDHEYSPATRGGVNRILHEPL